MVNQKLSKPEGLTNAQVLSKPRGMVTHSSGRHTQLDPSRKKYLLFQLLLEFGMSDTNLKSFSLTKKW